MTNHGGSYADEGGMVMVKKIILCVALIMGCAMLGGCDGRAKEQEIETSQEETVITSEEGKKPLLPDGEITGVEVTLVNAVFSPSTVSDAEMIKKLKEYFDALDLESEFPERPEDYLGGTWGFTFTYSDQRKERIYQNGNMFEKN